MTILISVQEADFDAGAALALLNDERAGGVASFIGIVRAREGDARRVVALTLEHYPGMTEAALANMAAAAEAKFALTGVTIIHRVGRLLPGQNIVFAAAAAAHRQAALQGTAFLIDWLKTAAPFWKQEEYDTGETAWVAPRATDAAAAAAWNSDN
jgi:molybdopterin synthase catalytic subunit